MLITCAYVLIKYLLSSIQRPKKLWIEWNNCLVNSREHSLFIPSQSAETIRFIMRGSRNPFVSAGKPHLRNVGQPDSISLSLTTNDTLQAASHALAISDRLFSLTTN
jgi:hypothetical protein